MRQLLRIFVFLLMLPVAVNAQDEDREIIPVNWKEVKDVADKDPDKIRGLVARMSASKLDTTMTWNERILAYYGQSFLTPFTESDEGRNLDVLMGDGKYEECLEGAREQLKKNPVSLKALFNAAFAIAYILKDTTAQHCVSRNEGQVYYYRMQRIFNTIAITGDGTEEQPFYVTAVSDEYLFMHYYLEIWEFERQFMTSHCDGFDLKESSDYYSRPQLFFEITRVLEIERDRYQK
jgi:hypothetical protein